MVNDENNMTCLELMFSSYNNCALPKKELDYYRAGKSTKNLIGQFLIIVWQLSKTDRAGYSKSHKK